MLCDVSDHPIREIRERSLQLLAAKLQLGWEIDDELSGARELLEALLAWFQVQKPTLQREALQLLLSTITVSFFWVVIWAESINCNWDFYF